MKRFDWAGASAFVLAFGLSAGFATALIFAASPATTTITDAGVQLLSTIGGAMVGAVAAYLGVAVERRGRMNVQTEGAEAVRTGPDASEVPSSRDAEPVSGQLIDEAYEREASGE